MNKENVINPLNCFSMFYYKYFALSELFKHCSNEEILECLEKHFFDNLLTLLDVLDAFREFSETPIIITSSFRNEAHNAIVGGSPSSQHMLGEAIDFKPLNMPFDTFVYLFMEFLEKSAFKKFVGQVFIYSSFIHIGLRTPFHKNLCIYDKRNGKINY